MGPAPCGVNLQAPHHLRSARLQRCLRLSHTLVSPEVHTTCKHVSQLVSLATQQLVSLATQQLVSRLNSSSRASGPHRHLSCLSLVCVSCLST